MPTPAAESKNSRRKKSEFFSLDAIYELQCRPGGINPKKCDATQDPSGSRLAASRISMRGGFQSQALKTKASLQLNNSPGQCRLSLTEEGIAGDAVKADCLVGRIDREWRQVRLVENVVEIRSEIETRPLTQELDPWQDEAFRQSDIDAQVIGALQDIPADRRSWGMPVVGTVGTVK